MAAGRTATSLGFAATLAVFVAGAVVGTERAQPAFAQAGASVVIDDGIVNDTDDEHDTTVAVRGPASPSQRGPAKS